MYCGSCNKLPVGETPRLNASLYKIKKVVVESNNTLRSCISNIRINYFIIDYLVGYLHSV